MPVLARADLESLLRARKLDRTLTSVLPPVDRRDDHAVAATGVAAFDRRLGGGWARGHLSELVGPASSGGTTLLLATLSAATRRGELAALVDALDALDVESAAAAGVELERLLWIRGFVVASPGRCREVNDRALEQAVKALTLVLQAGNFGVVALDLAGAPIDAVRRLPFMTWLRVQRMVEATSTAALLVGTEPVARSSAGVTVVAARHRSADGEGRPGIHDRSADGEGRPGIHDRSADREGRPGIDDRSADLQVRPAAPSRLFAGLDIEARVAQARTPQSRIANSESRDVCLCLRAAV